MIDMRKYNKVEKDIISFYLDKDLITFLKKHSPVSLSRIVNDALKEIVQEMKGGYKSKHG